MITKKQELILSELRSNSRLHLADIARKLNLPLSTVHDNYKIISKYIKQYSTLVDFRKIGYSLVVNFTFTAKGSAKNSKEKSALQFVLKSRNANSVYNINNKRTFLAECLFRNMNEAYEFKEKLQELGAIDIDMRYVIEEIKKEGFCSGK